MLHALILSVGQLGDPRMLRVLAKSLMLTLAIFSVLGVTLWWGMQLLLAQWIGWGATGLATVFALVATVLALWLLFRAVAIAVIALFADEVVTAVEQRHYPATLATAQPVSFTRGAAMGLRSAGRAVAINLLMLPVYLLLLATGVGTPAAFFLVNGWLLGRDMGDMVAARHMDRHALRQWRRGTRGRRFLLGLIDAGLFVVPFLNLLAPVLGAAMATHLFHRRET